MDGPATDMKNITRSETVMQAAAVQTSPRVPPLARMIRLITVSLRRWIRPVLPVFDGRPASVDGIQASFKDWLRSVGRKLKMRFRLRSGW
jgi:hypothetical protein